MRKHMPFVSYALGAALLMTVLGMQPALPQDIQLVVVDVKAVADGYRTSKLRGAPVYNDANDKIGTVDDVIIGQDRVLFAVLQVGGFLGLGGKLVAIPFQSLNMSGDKVILPGATKDNLKQLPEFRYT